MPLTPEESERLNELAQAFVTSASIKDFVSEEALRWALSPENLPRVAVACATSIEHAYNLCLKGK